MSKSAVLIVGSPKGPKSNSASLGEYLIDELSKRNFEIDRVYSASYPPKGEEDSTLVLEKINRSDLIILTYPLYVDSLPARLTALLEDYIEYRKEYPPAQKQRVLAIANNGFPESEQNSVSLSICRMFAREIGVEWLGGLAVGGGGTIGERRLSELGGMARNITRSIELAAEAAAEGHPIPEEARRLAGKPLVHPFLYTFIGNYGWRVTAEKHGAAQRLNDQPYSMPNHQLNLA